MNSSGIPSIPPPTFPTVATVVDPPNRAKQSESGEAVTHKSEPIHVPYFDPAIADATIPTLPPVAPRVVIPPPSTVSQPSNQPEKMAFAPSSTKSYKSKRTFKVIIVGDAGVGKTCLSYRFCCGKFPEHTEATIGVDFRERSCVIEKELLRVQLWDTAGQERYRQSIVAHYYRNVNAVVFVYDVTSKDSFDSLKTWIAECEKHGLTANADTPRILIGNKCDLPGSERVSMDVAQVFADKNNMALFETSAKADSEADHVESIFLTLLHKLQASKPMNVQTQDERQAKEQEKLVLKANERAALEDDGWCC